MVALAQRRGGGGTARRRRRRRGLEVAGHHRPRVPSDRGSCPHLTDDMNTIKMIQTMVRNAPAGMSARDRTVVNEHRMMFYNEFMQQASRAVRNVGVDRMLTLQHARRISGRHGNVPRRQVLSEALSNPLVGPPALPPRPGRAARPRASPSDRPTCARTVSSSAPVRTKCASTIPVGSSAYAARTPPPTAATRPSASTARSSTGPPDGTGARVRGHPPQGRMGG
jgi:hypothetical protein